MSNRKPMLTVPEQIDHLKDKGVTFDLCSEKEAAEYLSNNNNYFKLASYRKNYDKYTTGVRASRYISLDFAYLRDLAIIDMKLRYTCIQLALGIEHYAKLEILRLAEEHGEDGYQICEDFVSSLSLEQKDRLRAEIQRNEGSVYCGDLFRKYGSENLPLWVLLELIPFGRLVAFYGFCANRYDNRQMLDRHFLLKACKELRNASAHSSCILNDLHPRTARYAHRRSVRNRLAKLPGVSSDVCNRRMSNARIQQIITLLYAHTVIVTSPGVSLKASGLLSSLSSRILRHIDFYDGNSMIQSNLRFLCLVIDQWFPQK